MRVPPKLLTRRWSSAFVLINLFILMGIVSVQSVSTAIAAPSSQVRQVDVILNEWSIVPEDVEYAAGETIQFNILNDGRFPHALEISNSAIHPHSATIGAGETTTMEVTFDYGGSYGWLCPIPGHVALGMIGTLEVTGGSAAPDAGFIGTPLMRLSPRNGSAVDSTSQEVSVRLHDFTLDADSIGGANVAGEGNWELFLDGDLVDAIGETAYMLEDLTPGSHTITAALRNNDGTPLDPPLEASATIQVAQQVDVDMNEWNLIPADLSFQAGDRVVFNITNSGQFGHAIEVSNSEIHLHSPTISANQATTLAMSFDSGGEYTYVCPIPGHAALGMVGTVTVAGGDAPSDEGYIGIPLMRLNPRNGTEVEGDTQEVSVVLHDFTLDPDNIGGTNVAGEGYWALSLDGTFVEAIGTTSYILDVSGLGGGEHTLSAELLNNDGTSLDTPLTASRTIVVPQAAPPPPPVFARPPNVGDITAPAWMLAGVGFLGLLLVGSGAKVLARRKL